MCLKHLLTTNSTAHKVVILNSSETGWTGTEETVMWMFVCKIQPGLFLTFLFSFQHQPWSIFTKEDEPLLHSSSQRTHYFLMTSLVTHLLLKRRRGTNAAATKRKGLPSSSYTTDKYLDQFPTPCCCWKMSRDNKASSISGLDTNTSLPLTTNFQLVSSSSSS